MSRYINVTATLADGGFDSLGEEQQHAAEGLDQVAGGDFTQEQVGGVKD